MLSYHNACLVLDALNGTPLRTDADPSGLHRTSRDQQSPHKHRVARNTLGGGVAIDTLPDNMTRIVVRPVSSYDQPNVCVWLTELLYVHFMYLIPFNLINSFIIYILQAKGRNLSFHRC